jgi:hypothetical protein
LLPDWADLTSSHLTEFGLSSLFLILQAAPHGWSYTLRVVSMDGMLATTQRRSVPVCLIRSRLFGCEASG